jgi:hypothetical protein
MVLNISDALSEQGLELKNEAQPDTFDVMDDWMGLVRFHVRCGDRFWRRARFFDISVRVARVLCLFLAMDSILDGLGRVRRGGGWLCGPYQDHGDNQPEPRFSSVSGKMFESGWACTDGYSARQSPLTENLLLWWPDPVPGGFVRRCILSLKTGLCDGGPPQPTSPHQELCGCVALMEDSEFGPEGGVVSKAPCWFRIVIDLGTETKSYLLSQL